jgi:hypothetical protein
MAHSKRKKLERAESRERNGRDEENFGTFARTFNTLWLAMAFGMWEVNLPFINVETGSVDMGMLIYTIIYVIFMLWISLQVSSICPKQLASQSIPSIF